MDTCKRWLSGGTEENHEKCPIGIKMADSLISTVAGRGWALGLST